jgi:hypothetical protein
VSTPQDIALIDAVKGINMFKKVDVPVSLKSIAKISALLNNKALSDLN